jgi:hypothetical protein
MPDDDLPFKVVRTNSYDEVIARDANLIVGRLPTRPQPGSARKIVSTIATARASLRGASQNEEGCSRLEKRGAGLRAAVRGALSWAAATQPH